MHADLAIAVEIARAGVGGARSPVADQLEEVVWIRDTVAVGTTRSVISFVP